MAFGIIGWAVGLGAGTLYNPVMFNSIGGYGFFVYGGLNLVWYLLVLLFLPETSGRSLEEIDRLFETSHVFVWHMEKHHQTALPFSSPDDAEENSSKAEVEGKEKV